MPGPSEIEIRPVFEAADFGEALTPEIAELHDRIREKADPRRAASRRGTLTCPSPLGASNSIG